MGTNYQITASDKPNDAFWECVGGGIHNYNIQHGGEPHGRTICFILQAPDGAIAGGLIGETHWGWFYINLLFVKEELRGHGYGHQLLVQAEEAARQSGATRAYLDTFSFQAPDFYKQHGYQVFGELSDFPPGHQRYYLTKEL